MISSRWRMHCAQPARAFRNSSSWMKTYEELLAKGRPQRADIFSYDEDVHRGVVLHQRQHRHAEGA